MMYRPDAYPNGAIGPVQFLWQAPPPSQNDAISTSGNGSALQSNASHRKLWVWCHPAIQDTVLEEIKRAAESFNLKSSQVQSGEGSTEDGAATLKTAAVIVESLKLDLVRFRLIGPRSHALLMETLKPVFTFDEEDASSSGSATPCHSSGSSTSVWWRGDLQQHVEAHSSLLSQTLCFIKPASSPAQVCKGAVVGMTVLDPRLFTPSKKTDSVSAYYPKKKNGYLLRRVVHEKRDKKQYESDMDSDSNSCAESEWDESGVDGDTSDVEEGGWFEEDDDQIPAALESLSDGCSSPTGHQQAHVQAQVSSLQPPNQDLPKDIAFSPIWDPNVRDIVAKSKLPDHALNSQRSKQLTRPNQQDLRRNASRIPILLVQQLFGSTHTSGWDLILPANWGMAFWVSLVYRGARACGMRELQKCSLESQALHFPADYPDTSASRQYSDEQRQLLEAKYLRFPPDKRRNYGKLLIGQPFCCPWGEVVAAWNRGTPLPHTKPQDVDKNDQMIERHTPSKRMKLSSGRESPELFESHLETESQESVEDEGPRRRKQNLGGLTMNSDILPPPVLSTFYVLRSRDPLNCMQHFIEYLFSKKKTLEKAHSFTFSLESGLSMEASRFFLASMQQFQINEHLHRHSLALLTVRFETTQRGTIADRATISLPHAKDLQLFASSTGSERACSGPREELNQRGMTVVDGKTISIGVSSLSRKEVKEVKRKRLDKSKHMSKKKKNGECDFNMFYCVVSSGVDCLQVSCMLVSPR